MEGRAGKEKSAPTFSRRPAWAKTGHVGRSGYGNRALTEAVDDASSVKEKKRKKQKKTAGKNGWTKPGQK